MVMGQVWEIVNKYSVCMHVPPMVGSVHLTSALVVQRRTWLMAETLPLRKNVTFASLFDFHLMRVDLLVYKNHEGLCNLMEGQKLFHQNTWNGDMRTSLLKCILNGVHFICWCIIDCWWTRRDRKFCSGHCFLSFSFLWASLLCLPVYMCQTWKRHACV